MSQPGARSRIILAVIWLLLGAVMIGVPVWVGWTRWQAVLAGHPLDLGLLLVCGLVGIVAVVWAVGSLVLGDRLDREDERARRTRTPAQLRRRAKRRILLAVPALVVCTVLVSALAYARPLPASAAAVAATRSSDTVRYGDRLTWFELVPTRLDKDGDTIRPTTAFVFAPGARVDSRAYATVLRPLAEAGFLVVVLKEPLGFSLLDTDHAQRVVDVHPEITTWAVGGHSLGGVAAATFAADHPQVKGLVLFASYPAGKIERTDLRVLSVSGTADGLSTPTEIEAAKADLPPDTEYVVLDQVVHADFGDYGEQPGDGTPTLPRETAQQQITQVTAAFLASLAPPAGR